MTVPPNENVDTPSDVHLPWFWTLWRRNHQWRDKVNQQMVRKSLDLPDDEMNISTYKSGIGTAGAIGIAMAAGIPGLLATALMGYMLLKQPKEQPPTVPDSEYEVLFYDADGKPISVPHISAKPK